MSDPHYSLLDKIQHRVALGAPLIARMSFALDQYMAEADGDTIKNEPHVFLAGLARAGTTILMRRFHASGAYRSLTCRDMPFVLTPNLRRRISSISRRNVDAAETAYGDRIFTDADSPDSFDEVFWRAFTQRGYLRKSCLVPHRPSKDVVERYRNYVAAILESGDMPTARYLCRNNNNVLRLPAIRAAFPKALILIPIREPLAQARSLLTQHRRFSALQVKNPFMHSYMTLLGNYEFGLGHLPYQFSSDTTQSDDPNTLDYWLGQWCNTYDWLERTKPASAFFVGYEDLCTDKMIWRRLAARADIPPAIPKEEHLDLQAGAIAEPAGKSLKEIATQMYTRLRAQAYDALVNDSGSP